MARVIHELLSMLGREHPQALVFPLSVAAKSGSIKRQLAANSILMGMNKHWEGLVNAALLVSKELIRVAILWPEMWYTALEQVAYALSFVSLSVVVLGVTCLPSPMSCLQAADLFFGRDKDYKAMLERLAPLHAMIEEPVTQHEVSFLQVYGSDLQRARDWCNVST